MVAWQGPNRGEIVEFDRRPASLSGSRRRPLASTTDRRNHCRRRSAEERMIEADDKEPSGGRATPIALAARREMQSPAAPISFDRNELNKILEVYGRRVADGEWRDYAIDHLGERAVFSIFRRSSEMPLYRIVKQPKLARRQGA